ncbi:hypothetical protein [Rhodoferax sp.]|uniref:hypothetical protein n=1 Tax=Rhodoferax sp. TaxID=50421 RepID=UPI0025D033C9|nr:hypothetical protein [Rhodoferax sp.]
MLTVAELPEFTHAANKLLTESQRQDIILHLAEHPKTTLGQWWTGQKWWRSRHLLLS